MSGYLPEDAGYESEDQQRWRNYLSGVESADEVITVRSWQYIIEEIDEICIHVISEYPQLRHVSAEDLRQVILLKLQDATVRSKLFGSTRPHGYLVKMVQNHAIDLLRRSRVERKVFHEFLRQRLKRRKSNVPDERVRRLNRELAKLNNEEHMLVEMRFGLGLPIEEIAARLGIGYAAAATRLHRVKEKLRRGMAD